MPLPRGLARFNRYVTNPLARVVAGRLPGFAIVHHRGRRTGRPYRTPVNLFPDGDGYLAALTYGPGADWVRNVLAADGCRVQHRGTHVELVRPRLVEDADVPEAVPPGVRVVLRWLDVDAFLHFDRAT